ncbi:LD-carboxypeptidase [candidate division KSB1 bacterium]|nr:LD-carboxypeptidase [candidate division KSB1 bacterium]
MSQEKGNVSRRQFIGGLAATSAVGTLLSPDVGKGETLELRKPAALHKGDWVGLISPASPVFEPSSIQEGIMALEKLGFRVKPGKHIDKKFRYLAGSDQERAHDLMDMFTDAKIKAIFALRGGYGTIRILPYLNYDVIRRHPKILIGYSDITSLHLAIHKLAGIVTFHGAVALSTFNDYSTKYFWQTLGGTEPIVAIDDSPEAMPMALIPKGAPDKVRGKLIGGNLTLLTATLGTPYEPDTTNKILFLEEVGEEPYSLDRMFSQLEQAGKFRSAAAVLIDRCNRCKPADYRPAFENSFSVEELVKDRIGPVGVPVVYGLAIGHVANKPVLPLGIEAEVDLKNKRIALVERAVEP